MYCHNCGKPLIAGANFCQNCGAKVEALPDDLVAQAVEDLDLSEDVFNNNAQVEYSAQWVEDNPNLSTINTKTSKVEPKITYQTITPYLKLQIRSYNGNYSYCLTDENNCILSQQYEEISSLVRFDAIGEFYNIAWSKVRCNNKWGLIIVKLSESGKSKIQEIPCVFDDISDPYKPKDQKVQISDAWRKVDSKFVANVKFNSSPCALLLPSGKLFGVEKKVTTSDIVIGLISSFAAAAIVGNLIIGEIFTSVSILVELKVPIMIIVGLLFFVYQVSDGMTEKLKEIDYD